MFGAIEYSAVLLVLGAILDPAIGQVPFLGKCPEQEVVQNFNVTAYLGKWYEQQRYFAIFQLGGNCVTAVYSDAGDGKVGVLNTQTNLLTEKTTNIEGTAEVVGTDGEAKLGVRFPSVGNNAAPYWVLDTDYENYSIVWSCTNIFSVSNVQFAWVLTRRKNPTFEVMLSVQEKLEKRGIATAPFRRTLQVCDN